MTHRTRRHLPSWVWILAAVYIWAVPGGGCPEARAKTEIKATIQGWNSYLKGVGHVKKKQYDTGIVYLSNLTETHPRANWQDDAHYWLAYAYLAHDNPKRDIKKAQAYFRRLIKNYPKTKHRWNAENYLKLIEEVLQPRREVDRIKQELLKE